MILKGSQPGGAFALATHLLNAEDTRNDILRVLSRYLDDPQELKNTSERVMGSPQLVRLSGGSESNRHFTTRSFQKLEQELFAHAKAMAECKSYGVQPQNMLAAIQRQNTAL